MVVVKVDRIQGGSLKEKVHHFLMPVYQVPTRLAKELDGIASRGQRPINFIKFHRLEEVQIVVDSLTSTPRSL